MRNSLATPALLLFLGVFSVLFLFPIAKVFELGLFAKASYSIFSDPFFWHILRFTYTQALLSAVLSGIVGVAAAFLYSEFRFAGKSLFWRLSLMCFSFPTILVVLAISSFWGKHGPIAFLSIRLFGWFGILVCHTFLNFAVYLKLVGLALTETDRSAELSALTLGASRLRTFFVATLPKLWPSLRSAFLLTFLYTASSFLVVLLLGGGPAFTTIEVGIYEATKIDFDIALAIRLALAQLVVSLFVFFLFRQGERKSPSPEEHRWMPVYLPRTCSRVSLSLVLGLVVFCLLCLFPLFTFLAQASLGWQKAWQVALWPAFLHSCLLAFFVAALSTGLGFCAAYAQKHRSSFFRLALESMCLLPLSVSTLLLSLGVLIAYPSFHLLIHNGWLAAVGIQSMIALPILARAFQDGFSRISEESYQTAATLGAGTWSRLRYLEIPSLRNAFLLSLGVSVGFSLGDVGANLLFLSPGNRTLPVLIYELMSRYAFSQAYAVGGVLFILMGVVYLWLGRWES